MRSSRSGMYGRHLVRAATLVLLVACGGEPVAPLVGRLPVVVVGLPAGVAAAVNVVGAGTQRNVTESAEVADLAPGTYSITASEVIASGVRYTATSDRSEADVPPGGRGPLVRVTYAAATGRLAVIVSGLPPVPAAITLAPVAGPSLSVTGSTTLDLLAPGAYSVTVADVVVGGVTYRADLPAAYVVVTSGSVPATLSVQYGTGTGQLSVGIAGVPADVGADVLVSGPGGYERRIRSSTGLQALQPGTYQVTPAVVGGDLTTYTPDAARSVTVTSGATSVVDITYTGAALQLRLELVTEGLNAPVFATSPPGDSRIFVVERQGRVRIVRDGALLATPFLDIESRVNFVGERGLLGFAFDPLFAGNGRFYAYYVNLAGNVTLERFASVPGADVATGSEGIVITIPHGGSEHHGGMLAFGADRMLYLAVGDGRCCGDPDQNAQNLFSRLGKILRFDVRQAPYAIPVDNPFAGSAGPGVPELWAWGLRSPWRFSFDDPTGVLYIGDVGQDAREEINAVPATEAGLNYGWPRREGTACYSPATNCDGGLALTAPVHEYTHADGCSVTGGYVYRGRAIPELRGRYLYADYCRGWLRSFRLVAGAATEHRQWEGVSAPFVVSFGTDHEGEIYLVAQGRLWRLVRG